jgi:hypothetical protein
LRAALTFLGQRVPPGTDVSGLLCAAADAFEPAGIPRVRPTHAALRKD